MVSFSSLLRVQGVVSVPAAHGSLVFWYADGSCRRVPASYSSLEAVRREVAGWAAAGLLVVSVSFWVGSVLVARSFGGDAVALGACDSASVWRARVFVA